MTDEAEIIQYFKSASEAWNAGFYAAESCSLEEAQEKLGLQFPPSYLELVAKLKEQGVPAQDIVEAYTEPPVPAWPKCLVPFYQDGHGNCYCFDTRSVSEDGEYAIVFWDHEILREENIARMGQTDASFAEWAARYSQEMQTEKQALSITALEVGCVVGACLVVFFTVVGIVATARWLAAL